MIKCNLVLCLIRQQWMLFFFEKAGKEYCAKKIVYVICLLGKSIRQSTKECVGMEN